MHEAIEVVGCLKVCGRQKTKQKAFWVLDQIHKHFKAKNFLATSRYIWKKYGGIAN